MLKIMEKELRSIEIRTIENSRKIEGVSIVFNALSNDLGGFREQIIPEAVEGVIEQSDIFFLYNHTSDRGFLARSRNGSGSLQTEVREDGVYFSFDAPKTALGDEVLEYLKRGDVNQCSFAFAVDTDKWEKQTDGTYIRTITKFKKLYDMSLVDNPAYSQTSACARFAEIKEEERLANEKAMKEAEERAAAEAAEAKAKLEEYYNTLKENNKDYMPE
jgi:HK97 family phage prohead protease